MDDAEASVSLSSYEDGEAGPVDEASSGAAKALPALVPPLASPETAAALFLAHELHRDVAPLEPELAVRRG